MLARGPDVLPIPGTTRVDHLRDDLGAWDMALDASVLARLDALWDPKAVCGMRYNAQSLSEVDTEEFFA